MNDSPSNTGRQHRPVAIISIVVISVIIVGLIVIGAIRLLHPQENATVDNTQNQTATDQEVKLASEDTSRKTDINSLVSVISSYQTQNRGRSPAIGYLNSAEILDKMTVIRSVIDSGKPTTSQALYTAGMTCSGEKSSRAFSVTTILADGQKYCVDS